MPPLPNLLLHICCGPDATAVVKRLSQHYQVVGFFHNPNIHPQAEFERRRQEAECVAAQMKFELIVPDYRPDDWMKYIHGLEQEPEKGRRCEKCYEFNLKATALQAQQRQIAYFTTTLTISPHKPADKIIAIGRTLGQLFGVQFLEQDFKQNDGFKLSVTLSRAMGLYRQKYCGCRYSLRVSQHA